MNKILNTKRNTLVDAIMILLLYVSAAMSMYEEYLPIILYAVIPFVFALSVLSYGNPFSDNRYMRYLIIMYAWIGLTYFGAIYSEEALVQMKQILGVVLMCSICANLAKNERNIHWLYGLYIVYYIAILRFAQQNVLENIVMYEERLDDEKMNANMLAYFTFYITIAIYMLGEFVKSQFVKKTFRILFLTTIALSFFIAMLTASRQVLIIQAPLYVILMFIRYAKSYKGILLISALLLGIGLLFSDSIKDVYEGSVLQERNEMEVEDDERVLVMREAVQYGLQHPIFGLGPGNFAKHSIHKVFSHCTYTELWANSGIIALFIYVIMLLKFIILQWQRYRQYRQIPYLLFFIFGVFFALDNFFYVFYSGLWLMGFFILVAAHSEAYHNNRSQIRIN